ncbi:MAG: adenine-specific methyltransferase EcoRI family protein [Prevotellaceae bacterium]|nr:adenine-specific methyltransferase EcoRI family protein [Candidatus Faecinaster equi]
MAKNSNLHNAKSAKNDEFYTQYNDIAKEISAYGIEPFEGKVVLCNCDDPIESNFTKYFILNFRRLKLKRLICTFYDVVNYKRAYAFTYDGQDLNGDGVINGKDIEIISQMKAYRHALMDDYGFDPEDAEKCNKRGIYGSGDFRSQHCIEYLKQADIVVTNPPFSLFREYVAQLMEYGKKFIIVGNMNAITYKEIFPDIKNNKLWLGQKSLGTDFFFDVPENYVEELKATKTEGGGWRIIDNKVMGRVANACWFTNVEHKKRHTPIDLYKIYSNESYPHYDNYDAIEVSKVTNIPMDYDGVMGVPITFLDKYCPEQFEIIGHEHDLLGNGGDVHINQFEINGKGTYKRILIKRIS